MNQPLVRLTHEKIDPQEALEAHHHPSCGAVVTFSGHVRNHNKGQKVLGLEYEVYEGLFCNEVDRIIQEIKEHWKIHQLSLIQRTGKLDVGELGIFIAVSSPHRREAFEACNYAIEEFKKRAPVWKKEYYQLIKLSSR